MAKEGRNKALQVEITAVSKFGKHLRNEWCDGEERSEGSVVCGNSCEIKQKPFVN